MKNWSIVEVNSLTKKLRAWADQRGIFIGIDSRKMSGGRGEMYYICQDCDFKSCRIKVNFNEIESIWSVYSAITSQLEEDLNCMGYKPMYHDTDRLDDLRYAMPCLQIAKTSVADMYPKFILSGDYDGDSVPRSINVGRRNGKSEMVKRMLNAQFGTSVLDERCVEYCKNDTLATKSLFDHINQKDRDCKFEIDKVMFNEPATIVFWKDGTKTVVKAQGEMYDPEKGLAMAIARKALGNKGSYYDIFDKWMKTYKPKSVMEAKMDVKFEDEVRIASADLSASLDNSFIKNCVVRVEEFPLNDETLDNRDICCDNCAYNPIDNDDFPCADCDDFDEFVLRKDLNNGTTSKDTSKN